MTEGIFRKFFPKSMISNEIWNFVNSGNDPGEFPETFSNIWKHLWNIFSWVSTLEIYLEIVSGKSPESRPKIAKSRKSLEKVSGISSESPPVLVSRNSSVSLPEFTKFQISFEIFDFGKSFLKSCLKLVKIAFGKSFPKILWVTARVYRSSQLWTRISFSGKIGAEMSHNRKNTLTLIRP